MSRTSTASEKLVTPPLRILSTASQPRSRTRWCKSVLSTWASTCNATLNALESPNLSACSVNSAVSCRARCFPGARRVFSYRTSSCEQSSRNARATSTFVQESSTQAMKSIGSIGAVSDASSFRSVEMMALSSNCARAMRAAMHAMSGRCADCRMTRTCRAIWHASRPSPESPATQACIACSTPLPA